MNINLIKQRYQTHPYHLVDPSPWPIVLGFALLVLTLSAVMYMHGINYGGYFLNLGLILVSSVMALWFRDVIVEGTALSLFITQLKLSSFTLNKLNLISPSNEQEQIKTSSN